MGTLSSALLGYVWLYVCKLCRREAAFSEVPQIGVSQLKILVFPSSKLGIVAAQGVAEIAHTPVHTCGRWLSVSTCSLVPSACPTVAASLLSWRQGRAEPCPPPSPGQQAHSP